MVHSLRKATMEKTYCSKPLYIYCLHLLLKATIETTFSVHLHSTFTVGSHYRDYFDTMAFYDLQGPTSERSGLMVSIQGGGRCSNNVERTLNITMLCDMTAGVGTPELPPAGIVETRKCAYELQVNKNK